MVEHHRAFHIKLKQPNMVVVGICAELGRWQKFARQVAAARERVTVAGEISPEAPPIPPGTLPSTPVAPATA